jgi:hypothetical protein
MQGIDFSYRSFWQPPHEALGSALKMRIWSGRPGSNRRHPAWEAGVLLPRNAQVFQIQPVANNGNHFKLLRTSHPSHDLHSTPLLSPFSCFYGQYGQYEISCAPSCETVLVVRRDERRKTGAGDGDRTRNQRLGKPLLYH